MRQSLLCRFNAPLRIGPCHWWAGCGFLICTGPYTILQELSDKLRVSRFANPWVFGRGRGKSMGRMATMRAGVEVMTTTRLDTATASDKLWANFLLSRPAGSERPNLRYARICGADGCAVTAIRRGPDRPRCTLGHRRASGRAGRPVTVGARHLDERETGKEAHGITYALHALQPQVDGLRLQRLCLAQQ